MEDKFGRPYAKLSELKAGDWAELDDGFTCAPAGPVLLQADDGEHCVGVYIIDVAAVS